MKEDLRGEWIYGRRPVIEVLRAGKRHFHEVVMTETKDRSPELDEIRRLAATCNVFVKSAGREELARYTNEGNHQGVAIRTGGYPYGSIEEILARIEDQEKAIILILDHIEDPQNVGSLLRTAEAAGVSGVIIPEDRAAGVTAAAVRASAGGKRTSLHRESCQYRSGNEATAEGKHLVDGTGYGDAIEALYRN